MQSFGAGLLFSQNVDYAMMKVSQLIWDPSAGHLKIPTNLDQVVPPDSSQPARVSSELWRLYNSISSWDLFTYGIVPIIYAISALAVITWFLSLFVLTSYTIKASKILRVLIILALVYMLVVVVKCIVLLHKQHERGYFYGAELLDHLNLLITINIIDVIVIFFLQLCQVQIIMRLFSRQADKRTALLVGASAVTTSQVIWGVAHFYHFGTQQAGQIILAFIYLVRIVISLCYLAVILVQFVVYTRDIIANRLIWVLTALTLVFLYSPVAMFVADVSNSFIYAMTEVFLVVTNVVCVVLPWEWCNRFSLIMKRKEREGVLGRKVYDIGENRIIARGHDEVTTRRGDFADAVHWKFANVDMGQDSTADSILDWSDLKDSLKVWKRPRRPNNNVRLVDPNKSRRDSARDDSRTPKKNRNVYVYTQKTVALD